MHEDDLKNAITARKSQLKDALKKVPPEVVNGGIERAKAFKKWAHEANKMMSTPKPEIAMLDRLLNEYRAFSKADWLPPAPNTAKT